MVNNNLTKTKLPPPKSKITLNKSVNPKIDNSLYAPKVKKVRRVKKDLPSPVVKKQIPSIHLTPNNNNNNNVVNKQETIVETIDVNKNLFTLKELIDLNVDVDYTKKVFVGGQTKYEITNKLVLEQIQNGDWFKKEEEKQHDSFYNNAIDYSGVEEENQLSPEIIEENQDNFDQDLNYNQDNQEYSYFDDSEYDQQVYQEQEYKENLVSDQEYNQDYTSLEEHLEKPIDVETDEVTEPVLYESDYYADFEESSDYVEHGNYEGYQQFPVASEVVSNWNKKLWRTEDILYKIYNISYNQNHQNPLQGCLYNFSFDVFPGDRIAIMAHDSISDILLMDILSNRIEKDSGYVFFNLKREQKWFDIYSNEYEGFDIELFNRRNDAIYQFQSPDYLAYANNKNDTPSSTFKKVFNSVNYIINEQLFEDLLYLLDFEKDLKTPIHKLDELQLRRFIFICDVLIGKKVILMINLTEGFDIPQKLSFYRYINALYQDSDTVIIFNVKDSLEVKLLASRLIIIDDGEAVVNKKIKDILNSFETLDTFIVGVFDRLHKKYIQQN